jgi:HEPN domain-containing protein
MVRKPFSKRDKPQPHKLTEEISEIVRLRVFRTLEAQTGGAFRFALPMVGQRCETEYGHLQRSTDYPPGTVEDRVLEHFRVCDSDQALDFLEFLFQSQPFFGNQQAVDAINEIFREVGIGYEFTRFAISDTTMPNGGRRVELLQTPQAIRISNTLVHQTTTAPALQLLANPLCKRANDEMLQAHQLFRDGYFDKAIASAGQALESVLKIICEQKRWPLRPTQDTLGNLLATVKDQGLILDFYKDVLSGSGKVRNNIGAHGTATTPYLPATEAQAEHMIGMTAAHIVFLARLAALA